MAKFLVSFLILIILVIKPHLATSMVDSPVSSSRKLVVIGESRISPSEAPKGGEETAEVSASGGEEEVMEINHHHRHHSLDKSVAGGGVIVAGLVTAFLVAIFCYIRATRRSSVEPGSPTNSDLSVASKTRKPAQPDSTQSPNDVV